MWHDNTAWQEWVDASLDHKDPHDPAVESITSRVRHDAEMLLLEHEHRDLSSTFETELLHHSGTVAV